MSPTPVIGVVGLGAMGLGIAQIFAQAGHDVVATDSQAMAVETARQRMAEALDARVSAGKLSGEERERILARLHVVNGLAHLEGASLVVEAIIETLEAKQALFAEVERYVGDSCVLATNTSSLSVTAIMQVLRRRDRALGLHFFNPVPAMKLAELIVPDGVDPAAVEFARKVTAAAGKTVVTCADTPGFIVNRCARPFYGEALAMLEEGRSASEIDAAMQAAGYRLGPFSLIDLVGADIGLAVTESFYTSMKQDPRYHVFEALRAQVAKGDLGRKSGKGFLFPEKPGPAPPDADAIVLRSEATLANEAASLAAAGAVNTDEIDTALKLGLNFPRGPFEAARRHGLGRIIEKLRALEDVAPPHLRGRYRAAPFLESLS